MPPRTLFPESPDAPVRPRLLAGWAVFFLVIIIGLWLMWAEGNAVPTLIDVVGA